MFFVLSYLFNSILCTINKYWTSPIFFDYLIETKNSFLTSAWRQVALGIMLSFERHRDACVSKKNRTSREACGREGNKSAITFLSGIVELCRAGGAQSRLLHISLQCRCRRTSQRALVGSHFIRNEFNFLKDAGKSMFVFVQFQSLNEYFMKIR